MHTRIPVAISRCLLGDNVRYNGDHKHNRFCTSVLAEHFEFVPTCPEVEVGMSIPRKPVRLVQQTDHRIAVVETDDPSKDYTRDLTERAHSFVQDNKQIAGFIATPNSPSCGYCYSSELGSEPFRWTADAGMQPLGRLADGGNAVALAASGDGTVIVGYSESAVAFVWDANHGMRNLRDVLTQRYGLDLTGWELQEAAAISPDAGIIVGQGMHGGRPEGWIARVEDLILPELRSDLVGGELVISWPAPSPGWRLEAITGLTDGSAWTEIPGPYHTGENGRITSAGALPDGNRFYRLAKP